MCDSSLVTSLGARLYGNAPSWLGPQRQFTQTAHLPESRRSVLVSALWHKAGQEYRARWSHSDLSRIPTTRCVPGTHSAVNELTYSCINLVMHTLQTLLFQGCLPHSPLHPYRAQLRVNTFCPRKVQPALGVLLISNQCTSNNNSEIK